MSELPAIVAEIGINHNGSVDIAMDIINEIDFIARRVGYPLDLIYYKFQKRVPEESVPEHMWYQQRVSPVSGRNVHYIDYKREIEFGLDEYGQINYLIPGRWFVSVWDIPSFDFINNYFPSSPYIKVPSPHITNLPLIRECLTSNIPIIISTGMSTQAEISSAMREIPLQRSGTHLLACTSSYPCWDEDVHLNKIEILRNLWGDQAYVGYSNHSPSTYPPIYAGLLGAKMIEMHVTLNRAMPGSDHSASLEMRGVELVLRELLRHEKLLGPQKLVIFDSELEKKRALRGV